MSLQSYTQNVNNAPFGLANTNAPGSPYAAAYGRGVTSHLMLPVSPIIFDAQPQQFLDLQYLMAFATEEAPGDEIIWHENVWSRSPIVTASSPIGDITGQAPVPGSTVTDTVVVTPDSLNYVYVGQKIHYTDDNGVPNQVIVSNVDTNTLTVTLRSMVGVGIGALTAGNGVNLTNGMTAGGDGFQTFSNPVRTKTVRRTNLIEKVGPEQMIWNRLERLKWKNQAQTNFMEVDMRNVLTQLKVSMAQRIWLGQYGEGLVSYSNSGETAIAKFTEGIVPSIINNGGAVLNSTMSTVWDDLTTGIFQTNFGPLNNERVIFGTPEMLHALNLKQKAEFVRYSAGDKIWDLDFEEWRFGGQKITLVPTQIWNDAASFPEEYARRLVVLQKSSVKLVTMRGVAMISQEAKVSQSRTNTTPFEIYDFERYTVEGMVGVKVQNAAQSFIIDVA